MSQGNIAMYQLSFHYQEERKLNYPARDDAWG